MINKKILVTLGLSSVVTIVALTSMKANDPGYKNLKVLPKNLTHEQLGKVMHDWSNSLGVHCDFCHARNEAEKKMDFASDAKPEKKMAREMFKMMNKINSKYFDAKKDSLGFVMTSGVNCYTCHRGESHPETKIPERKGPGGPPSGTPPAGTPPAGAPQGDHK
ncbi:MAG: c-type cytochrome [Bacteroidota bacterium]